MIGRPPRSPLFPYPTLSRSHGHEPVLPPVLVREEAMYGTGMLPDTEQQLYRLADDDLYLVGTSEVPLASLHAGQRSEEHTSELQSRQYLVCRLLLDKKKIAR